MKITSLSFITKAALILTVFTAGIQAAQSVASCEQKALDACVEKIIDSKNEGKPKNTWVAPSWMAYQGYQTECASKLGCNLPKNSKNKSTDSGEDEIKKKVPSTNSQKSDAKVSPSKDDVVM